jgi:hypothetical protein
MTNKGLVGVGVLFAMLATALFLGVSWWPQRARAVETRVVKLEIVQADRRMQVVVRNGSLGLFSVGLKSGGNLMGFRPQLLDDSGDVDLAVFDGRDHSHLLSTRRLQIGGSLTQLLNEPSLSARVMSVYQDPGPPRRP